MDIQLVRHVARHAPVCRRGRRGAQRGTVFAAVFMWEFGQEIGVCTNIEYQKAGTVGSSVHHALNPLQDALLSRREDEAQTFPDSCCQAPGVT